MAYRTKEWDIDFMEYLKSLEQTKPVILTGDLNVISKDIDIYETKGREKLAGMSP